MITRQLQRARKAVNGFLLSSVSILLLACSTDNDSALQYDAESTLNAADSTQPNVNYDDLEALNPNNPVNWFSNGGAESGTSPWYPQGDGVTATQSDAQQRSGQYSLLVQGRTETWNGPVMPILSGLPKGEIYEANVWVRLAEGEMPASVQLAMKVDTDGADPAYPFLGQAEATADAWTRLSGTYSHELDGDVTEISVYVQSPNATVSFYVDDLSFEPQGNLMFNGDVEAGIRPWRFQGEQVMLSHAAEQARSGDYSLLVTGRAEEWHGPIMDLPNLAAGQSYRASVWVRLAPSTEATDIVLTLKRTEVGQTAQFTRLEQATVTGDDWVELAGAFTHPVGPNFDEVLLLVETETDGASASFYVDDLEVRITTLDYVINGDVETGLSDWYPFGPDVVLTRTDADAYSGNYSLHIGNRDQNWQGASFGFAELAPGETYGFSCWVKMAPENPEADLALMIKRVDDESGEEGAYLQLSAETVTADDWVQLSGTYQHMPVGELLELTAYVNASIDTAEFLIDACAINLQ